MILLFILLLLAAAAIFGTLWYRSMQKDEIVDDDDTLDQLNNAGNSGGTDDEGTECTLHFTENVVNPGETVTGIIQDGRNATCGIYYRYNSGPWQFAGFITTDQNGEYSETRTPEYVGMYEFVAICEECTTNLEKVEVVVPDDGSENDHDSDQTYYCTASWPIPDSQESCDERYGCADDEYCKYFPDTLVSDAMCACHEITSCADSCESKGYTGGYCSDQTDRDPCDGNYMNFAANTYCGLNKICCCT